MLADIIETSLYGFGLIDESFVFHYVNPALAEQTGRTPDELVGTSALDVVHPDDHEKAALGILEQMGPEELFDDLGVPISLRILRPDGSVVTLEVGAIDQRHRPDIGGFVVRTRPLRGEEHLNAGLHLLAQGASPREVLNELVLAVEGIIEDGCGVISARGRTRTWHTPSDLDPILTLSVPLGSGNLPELWERARSEQGCAVSFVKDMEPELAAAARAAGFQSCWVVPVSHASVEAGIVVWREKRRSPHVSARIALMRVADAVGLAIERDRTLRQLRHAASHDRLTGLFNRATFHEELAQAIAVGALDEAPTVGLLFVDLDEFKAVNDDYGHQVGDAVLSEVAERLGAAVRGTDVVGRLGGDEFAVLCRSVADQGEIEAVADRIVAALSAPIPLAGRAGAAVVIGASVGVVVASPERVSTWHESGVSAGERLLAEADRAMYEAKRAGGARWATDPLPASLG